MPAFELAPLRHWPIAAVLAVQAKAYAAHLVEQGEVLQGKVQAALPGQPLSWGIALKHAPMCCAVTPLPARGSVR